MFTNKNLLKKLKNSTVLITTTFKYVHLVKLSLENMLKIIEEKENIFLIIIDNHSSTPVKEYVKSVQQKNCCQLFLPFNLGRALAINFFFKEYVSISNYPKTIIPFDPDIIINESSLNKLIDASNDLPQCGMIGLRYKNNACNPERNLFFKPKKLIGTSKKRYYLSKPFMCTVAGGIFAVQANKIISDCNNEVFPKKEIKLYGGDDSALYDKFRYKYHNGYLEGTEAIHLRTGATECIPKELI